MPSPNDDRSRSKDPMQDDFRAANNNRANQIGQNRSSKSSNRAGRRSKAPAPALVRGSAQDRRSSFGPRERKPPPRLGLARLLSASAQNRRSYPR